MKNIILSQLILAVKTSDRNCYPNYYHYLHFNDAKDHPKFCFEFIIRRPQMKNFELLSNEDLNCLLFIDSVVKEWNKKVRSEAETSQVEKSDQVSATYQHICNVSIQTYQCSNVSVTEKSNVKTRSSWLNCALRDDVDVYWVSIGHYEVVGQ